MRGEKEKFNKVNKNKSKKKEEVFLTVVGYRLKINAF